MSMQMRIRHTTVYTYDEENAASYTEARLTPMTTVDQYVRRARIEITPAAWSQQYHDYWGTPVTAFEVTEPHSQLVVSATSVVDTADVQEVSEFIDWDVLADPKVIDDFCEFLAQSPTTLPATDLVERVAALREQAERPVDLVLAVCDLVRGSVKQLVAATHVTATAQDTWTSGQGVAADLVHVVIGALRSIGIPARFIGGYLHPVPDPQVGVPVVTEPHAWLEWWNGSWTGWDVTVATAPSERHVQVSMGRDFSDLPPLRGIHAAEGSVHAEVTVQITRVA